MCRQRASASAPLHAAPRRPTAGRDPAAQPAAPRRAPVAAALRVTRRARRPMRRGMARGRCTRHRAPHRSSPILARPVHPQRLASAVRRAPWVHPPSTAALPARCAVPSPTLRRPPWPSLAAVRTMVAAGVAAAMGWRLGRLLTERSVGLTAALTGFGGSFDAPGGQCELGDQMTTYLGVLLTTAVVAVASLRRQAALIINRTRSTRLCLHRSAARQCFIQWPRSPSDACRPDRKRTPQQTVIVWKLLAKS